MWKSLVCHSPWNQICSMPSSRRMITCRARREVSWSGRSPCCLDLWGQTCELAVLRPSLGPHQGRRLAVTSGYIQLYDKPCLRRLDIFSITISSSCASITSGTDEYIVKIRSITNRTRLLPGALTAVCWMPRSRR